MWPRKISSKLYVSFTVVIVGFMIFGFYFFNTLNTVKVNGPIYNQLVEGKDLVADEIRKLAESSGSQAKTVSNTLKKINDSMKVITGATDLLLKKFEDIDSRIQQFSAQEQGIMNAMAEQSSGSKEILSAIDLLNGISVSVRSGSGEMLVGSREVIQESATLGKITANINDSMKSMTAKSADIDRVVTRVNAIGDETRSSIESLIGEIGKFKVS